MATRGYNLSKEYDKVNEELQKYINRETDAFVERLITHGKKTMRNSYKEGIHQWYSESKISSRAANKIGSTVDVDVSKQKSRNKNEITILFTGYIDKNKYENLHLFKSAEIWREQHMQPWTYHIQIGRFTWVSDGIVREPLDMPYTANEYVMNLQWDKGIIGLPAKETKTGTGWINNNFRKNFPMERVVSKRIVDGFNKLYDNPKLTQRHSTQGTGTHSSNRGGMNNLSKHRSKADRK